MKGEREFAKTYLGVLGKFLPMMSMIAGILIMLIMGMRGMSNMQAACFIAMIVGWLVYKDKKAFQNSVIKGLQSPVLANLIPIMLLSCVLGELLVAAHLSEGLLYWATRINLSPAFMPVLIFFMGAIVSLASGSSAAAITGLRPILLPMAYAMGCNPALCTGALIASGQVGDNLAPISDSTITSAMTQEVDVTKAFRYRIKYSVICSILSAVLYIVFGYIYNPGSLSQHAAVDASYASSAVFLVIPVLIMAIMLKTNNFFNAVLSGELVCVIMLLAFGYVAPVDIFSADGLIASGLASSSSTIIFLLLIFIILSISSEAGCMQAIQDMLSAKAGNSVRKREIAASLTATASVCMIGAGSSSISFCGPLVRDIMRSTNVARARTASIIGGICSAGGSALPWSAMIGAMPGLVIACGGAPEGFSGIEIVPYIFYCIIMFIVYWIITLTGWDMKTETKEELLADGIKLDE